MLLEYADQNQLLTVSILKITKNVPLNNSRQILKNFLSDLLAIFFT